MKKDLTGLLLVFIGLIISLFIGFGFILTLIGLFMLAGKNENFRKSRNMFIGTLITSIASFFVLAAMGGVGVLLAASSGTAIAGLVGFIIAIVIILIALYFFNIKSYYHLLAGCEDLALEAKEAELAHNCRKAYTMYKNSLLATTILGILTAIFMWVPVLNILLMIAAICVGIWYFVAQIFVIVRVWQTYDKYK